MICPAEFLVPYKQPETWRPPALPAAAAAVQLDQASVPIPTGLKVLIVEDDELNCLVMATSLEVGVRLAFGIKVHTTIAHTAEDALTKIGDTDDFEFDMVVSDQHMENVGGEMKGSELIERLAARNYAVRPVLAIASANTDEAEKATYFASGADIVWPKPYPQNAQLAKDFLRVWNQNHSTLEQAKLVVGRKNSSKVVPLR